MKTFSKLVLLLAFAFPAYSQSQNTIDVKDIVGKLTVEEKVKLVLGTGMNIPGVPGLSTVGKTQTKVPGAAGTSYAIERLKLPMIVMADGPAGVRIDPKRDNTPNKTYYATGFPVATVLASSWDAALMENIGKAYGNEAKEYGVDFLLAPALNLHRNPLGGRNFEYYSEDPVVSGKMAAAFVRGLQSQGVGASVKHFVANNQETNRTKVNTIVSERALRELYLKGFEIAIKESDPWSVMSSYNKVNGIYTSENPELLTTILRNEWGFKGFVVTDWFAGTDPVKQMIAGNDLLMPGTPKQEQVLLEALEKGTLAESVLDKNVTTILNVYARTHSFRGFKASDTPDLEEHKKVAKEAATEGMVLLKNNEGTLPLKKEVQPIALFGVGSFETVAGGTGSGDVNKAYIVSLADGLEKIGLNISKALIDKYHGYIQLEKLKIPKKSMFFMPDQLVPEMPWTSAQLDSLAAASSIGVITLSRTSGEFIDRNEVDDFNLSIVEKALIQTASDAFHKNGKRLVVLLNIGGVIETASWKDAVDAILVISQPGQEAGHAVAEVLSGLVNPSGKLTMTFPVRYQDAPVSKNFPGIELEKNAAAPGGPGNLFGGVDSEVIYEEDIYVGYRYFDSFKTPVSFPFGFGLSYTSFVYQNPKVTLLADGNVSIAVTVKNTGIVAGKEVVQVYSVAPIGILNKPEKELKAFGKTRLLKKGESETLQFIVNPYDLASYDPKSSSWIADAGAYTFLIGSSSAKADAQGMFTLKTPLSVRTNKVLVPVRDINKLVP